ncbi:MAG TPA: serine/threonine protein kinase [Syntrophobacteraceae bacterium]|nr:serine/threonine protein kinase [Syntrophobacteraceae bacterium]
MVQIDTLKGQADAGFDAYPSSSDPLLAFYVNVLNVAEKGALIEASQDLEGISRLVLRILLHGKDGWRAFFSRPAWSRRGAENGLYLAGLEFLYTLENFAPFRGLPQEQSIPSSADLEFLLHTHMLDSIPEHALCHLLNCLNRKTLKAGERLFSQGDVGDALYIIQEGTCSVKLERGNDTCCLNRLREGDIVGEMAVLTGEPRSAHVEAETDMKLWGLHGTEFHKIAHRCPDLRVFLTELVTQRFEAESFTGDRHIGKYLIKGKLGKGGWSIVYQGIHKTLNLPVAIKMLKHNMAMEESFLGRFRDEAKIIAQLNHRNIVRVYDIEELFQTVFIVMEYLDGQSLRHLLERLGRIPVARAVDLLTQICQGLAYAHGRGIIHQDIKPDNIFVGPDDHIKILDFGLACAPGSEDLNLAGTIHYAAPEQIEGDPVDVRTDIYALGITAYELITGSRPYSEDDLNEMIAMRLGQDIPDPGKLLPDLPEELCRFITKAARRAPGDRYQNIGEAIAQLQPLSKELCRAEDRTTPEKTKAMSVLFLYQDQHQLALKQLLDEFSAQLQKIGVTMKAASFEDI